MSNKQTNYTTNVVRAHACNVADTLFIAILNVSSCLSVTSVCCSSLLLFSVHWCCCIFTHACLLCMQSLLSIFVFTSNDWTAEIKQQILQFLRMQCFANIKTSTIDSDDWKHAQKCFTVTLYCETQGSVHFLEFWPSLCRFLNI